MQSSIKRSIIAVAVLGSLTLSGCGAQSIPGTLTEDADGSSYEVRVDEEVYYTDENDDGSRSLSFNGYEGVTFEQLVSNELPSSYFGSGNPRNSNALYAELETGLLVPVTNPLLKANTSGVSWSSDEAMKKFFTDNSFALKYRDDEHQYDIAHIPVSGGAKCWTDSPSFTPWAIPIIQTRSWTIGKAVSDSAASWGIRDNTWFDAYAFNSFDEVAGVSVEDLSGDEKMAAIDEALASRGVRYEEGVWVSDTEQDIECGSYSGTKWEESALGFNEVLWRKEPGVGPIPLPVIKTHEGLFEIDMSSLAPGYYVIDENRNYGYGIEMFNGTDRLICVE